MMNMLTYISTSVRSTGSILYPLIDDLRHYEKKPEIVNQQYVVYEFKCPLCETGYVGYTTRHLTQRISEHLSQSSSIGKHVKDNHKEHNFTNLKENSIV